MRGKEVQVSVVDVRGELETVIQLSRTMPDPHGTLFSIRAADPSRTGHGGTTDGMPFHLETTLDFWNTNKGDVRGIRTATGVDEWAGVWANSWWSWADDTSPKPAGNKLLWLHTKLDWAADHYPAFDEFTTELTAVRAILERAHGLDPVKTDRSGPCCGQALHHLVTNAGVREEFSCGECGSEFTPDGLELMTQSLAGEAHELVTQNVAAELLGTSRKTINSWIRRGKVQAYGSARNVYVDEVKRLAGQDA